jgi:hypothetical protein
MPHVDDTLMKVLTENGYSCIITVPGRGVCGIARMAFTTGLFYGMDEACYQGRYCYETMAEAIADLLTWDGTGDPSGDWIKHKGGAGEYSNPNNSKYNTYEGDNN